MTFRNLICNMAFVLLMVGCAPPMSLWRHDATLVLDRVRMEGADRMFPDEFRSAEDAMNTGEILYRRDDVPGADKFFLLALTKGNLLEEHLVQAKRRHEEEERQAEARRLELIRQQEIEEELKVKREKERAARPESSPQQETKKRAEKRPAREKPLPTYHTAKRGETLPLIAAQPEVYNDPSLWPLLYRANRDQIKDPRHIWPGQVLRIPRNLSRDDISEARRYSQERPIY